MEFVLIINLQNQISVRLHATQEEGALQKVSTPLSLSNERICKLAVDVDRLCSKHAENETLERIVKYEFFVEKTFLFRFDWKPSTYHFDLIFNNVLTIWSFTYNYHRGPTKKS